MLRLAKRHMVEHLLQIFDSVESLYDLWLNELNTAIASFTSGEVVMKSEEDVV